MGRLVVPVVFMFALVILVVLSQEDAGDAAGISEGLQKQLRRRSTAHQRFVAIISFARKVLEVVQRWIEKAGLGPYVDKLIDFSLAKPVQTVIGLSSILTTIFIMMLPPDRKKKQLASETGKTEPVKNDVAMDAMTGEIQKQSVTTTRRRKVAE
uniref:ADP,ATP carrier protein n=1 Tax=Rhodosorus marinus TaxID=101924 RepID=A0A7S2ZST0_9RHOD|mmetsp:Transcript_29010/g.112793  ORF Transcript_29010/g.112793 Transcript_29010/m.112793 type:complete len:154 (+) Transcript_29010:262-723(+)